MGYIEDKLTDGEHVVYRTKLHWATLLGPGTLIILAGLWIPSKGLSALALLALGVIWGIFSSISLQNSEIGITNKRLLLRVGFPLRRSCDIPLETIQMVDIYQPSLGKFLNFGKIIIQSVARRRYAFRMIVSPIELRDELAKQVNSIRQQ
ncbi:MAG: PH domain-containing protein [Proteobacteria bacterium]|nr:PH domain-containing protein [Pseudomonadota bacterium]